MELGEKTWDLVSRWNYFNKDTIGKQLVRAIDSVSANISEGFGRYHFKENKHFLYYARGSLSESKTWITKAYNRKLIEGNEYKTLIEEIEKLSVKLNNYINSIGKTQHNK
ncbi:MAG: four helix bundle protein [Bacteroidetes bacterium]|nr:four helix bundle protein [Bacteroidota bacterium]